MTAPVTLSLALTGQDGSAEPTGSMTLASDTVTVPAGGTSSVEVLLDPTIADPGAYSAVVTATPDDGGGTVRTGLAYLLEPERYDVTVTVKPRVGTQAASHELGLSSFGEPWIYEQRSFGAAPGAQTATFRLPPGTYTTGAISFGLAGDGAKEGIVSYEPSFTVSKDTEIVLDENQTGRFGYQVDRPVVDDGAILDVGWTTTPATTGCCSTVPSTGSTAGPRPAWAGPRRWPPTGCSASPRASSPPRAASRWRCGRCPRPARRQRAPRSR